MVDRLHAARTTVERDHEPRDGVEGACGDQHRLAAGSRHAFQVRAQMQFGEIGGFAALADDDQAGVGLGFGDGVDDVAGAQAYRDILHAVFFETRLGVVEDGAAELL